MPRQRNFQPRWTTDQKGPPLLCPHYRSYLSSRATNSPEGTIPNQRRTVAPESDGGMASLPGLFHGDLPPLRVHIHNLHALAPHRGGGLYFPW
jgi:hypothetical protein